MSLVRALIQSREDWLEHLETEFKINVNRDGDLASLKYNQIESPMHEPIVQECRGMVVDVARRKVLAWPYNKFWNYGEALAAPVDWGSAVVYEKLDGSLMILYWNDAAGEWQVASSGTPSANGHFGFDASRTFRDAFIQVFQMREMKFPRDRDYTYMFELCALENRIVVKHDVPRLVLHGARHTRLGHEMGHGWLQQCGDKHGWEVVRAYPIGTIDGCLAAAEALDPMATEGFVVVDAQFNRIKIKSPQYVALHHMRGETGATPRRAIELWQIGETEEVLANFPEFGDVMLPVQDKLEHAAIRAFADYVANRRAPDRKTFALAVKDTPWSAVTFKLYQHEEPSEEAARTILRGLSLAALERIAGV